MSLIKIKRAAQITLPPDIRKVFNLDEGDYLEAVALDEGILLKPVVVVERKEAWDKLFTVLDTVDEVAPKSRKTPKQQEEEIAEIVKEVRKKKVHA